VRGTAGSTLGLALNGAGAAARAARLAARRCDRDSADEVAAAGAVEAAAGRQAWIVLHY
jgi:hypothetical protein